MYSYNYAVRTWMSVSEKRTLQRYSYSSYMVREDHIETFNICKYMHECDQLTSQLVNQLKNIYS